VALPQLNGRSGGGPVSEIGEECGIALGWAAGVWLEEINIRQ